jgi:hypothetical protein
MADLRLTFGDCYKEVARFLGWGITPSGQNLTDAKTIVHAGYKKFLYPVKTTGKIPVQYVWSFLTKDAVLAMYGAQWRYTMPSDFDSIYTRFTYDTNDQFMPMRQVSADMIHNHRVVSDSQGQPSMFAVVPTKYDPEFGQLNEVWFYETPSQSYTLHYSYIMRPPPLVNDADYFVGGDFASEAILECALAVAEIRWDGAPGTHTAEAEKLVQQLILNDNTIRPSYYGRMYDPGIRRRYYERPLQTIPDPYPS